MLGVITQQVKNQVIYSVLTLFLSQVSEEAHLPDPQLEVSDFGIRLLKAVQLF